MSVTDRLAALHDSPLKQGSPDYEAGWDDAIDTAIAAGVTLAPPVPQLPSPDWSLVDTQTEREPVHVTPAPLDGCFSTTILDAFGLGQTFWRCDREAKHDGQHHSRRSDGSECYWPAT